MRKCVRERLGRTAGIFLDAFSAPKFTSFEVARGTSRPFRPVQPESYRLLENKLRNDGRVKRRERMLNFSPSDHLILERLVVNLDR